MKIRLTSWFQESEYKAVIFDMDGTLTEICEDADPFKTFFQDHGYSGINNRIKEALEKCKAHEFCGTDWKANFQDAGIDTADTELIDTISDLCFERNKANLVLYPWVAIVMPRLSEQVPVSICTNNGIRSVLHSIGGLCRYFSYIITAREMTRLKPDPECILSISGFLGIDPENLLFIGDSKEDIAAAISAGANITIAGWSGSHIRNLDGIELGDVSGREFMEIPVLDNPYHLLEIFGDIRTNTG